MSQRSFAGLMGLIAGAALTSVAQGGITDPGLVFTATNLQGSASVSIALGAGAPLPGGGWQWVLVGPPIPIMSGPNLLGTITQGTVTLRDTTSPLVATSFAVTAGASNTTFQIASGEVSFTAMNNPNARASAGITVTDNTGNGASVAGNRPGASVYSAHYNGQAPLGVAFSDLMGGGATTPSAFGSQSVNQAFPAAPGAFTPIAGSVSSISALWDFTVSANDQASGTSVFVLVPAPGALGLLGMAGLVVTGRRRA